MGRLVDPNLPPPDPDPDPQPDPDDDPAQEDRPPAVRRGGRWFGGWGS